MSDLASIKMVSLWHAIRLQAEGSDWRRDSGETLEQWAVRKLKEKDRNQERIGFGVFYMGVYPGLCSFTGRGEDVLTGDIYEARKLKASMESANILEKYTVVEVFPVKE